jgi:hypothetical protein
VAVVQPLREARLLQEVLLLQLRRRSQPRRKRRKRSRTRTWASVYSIKDLRSRLFEQVEKKALRLLARRILGYEKKATSPTSAILHAQLQVQLLKEL